VKGLVADLIGAATVQSINEIGQAMDKVHETGVDYVQGLCSGSTTTGGPTLIACAAV